MGIVLIQLNRKGVRLMEQTNDKLSLAACRVNAGLTQQKLADLMGVSVATIVNWESYKTHMSAPQLVQFSEITNINPAKIKLTS